MSAKQITLSQLTCDGCGVPYPHTATPVSVVRARAKLDGWKHRAITYNNAGWAKQVDLCETCEEPQ